MVKISLILIIIFLAPSSIFAKREHPEKWYQEEWCEAHNGRVEVALPDGTRCDCVTATQAIEFDFATGSTLDVSKSTSKPVNYSKTENIGFG